jgi:mRNA interferase MazF
MKNFPRRGEVWLLNWNPARGSEQAGKRPALVIQNNIGNENASTTIVAAISGSVKIFPMNVKVEPPEGGLDLVSIVKTSQILTVDKNRLEKKLGQLTRETIEKVNQAIKLSLDL